MKYIYTFNESSKENQFFTQKEINLIEDIFIDFDKKTEFQYLRNGFILGSSSQGREIPARKTNMIQISFKPTGFWSLRISRQDIDDEFGQVNYSRISSGTWEKKFTNSDPTELDNFFEYKQDTLLDYLEKNYSVRSGIYDFFSKIKGLEYYKFKWKMYLGYVIKDTIQETVRGFDIDIHIYLSITK